MSRENLHGFHVFNPESVNTPDKYDQIPTSLTVQLDSYVARNPDIFTRNPGLELDITNLFSWNTPETVLDELEDEQSSKDEQETTYRHATSLYKSLTNALKLNLITDEVLKKEIENRLTRLGFYLGVYKEQPLSPERKAAISQKISEMHAADQAMRSRALEAGGVIETEEDNTLDRKNSEVAKEIVYEIGWPKISQFDGPDIPQKFWLLVQHADHDVRFQEYCLALMKALPPEEVDRINTAYLEDRVRVNQGRPQVWGTQFTGEGENYRPRPIEDPETVDARRLAIGLPTMAEYKKELKDRYKI